MLGALISALSQPVVDAITLGVSLLALAFEAASILRPWSLRLVASPNSYSGRPGSVLLTVLDPGPIQWPPALQDCAKQVTGEELPQLKGAANAPVAWTVEGVPDASQQMPLVAQDGVTAATQTSLSTETTKAHTAALDYVTASEQPDCPDARPVTSQLVIGAEVTRTDAKTIQSLIPDLLGSVLARIPGIIRPIFAEGVNAIAKKVADALRNIAGHDSAVDDQTCNASTTTGCKNARTLQVPATITTGCGRTQPKFPADRAPAAVAVSPAAGTVYVSNGDNTVSIIPAAR